ncbi:MAG: radical SAM protein [Pirellulales bacterium]
MKAVANSSASPAATRRFAVEVIKPSHYDDDGYVIQWWRAFVPSNSLACMYGLVQDVEERRLLGEDVRIEFQAYDESHTVIPIQRIIQRIRSAEAGGVVLLVGVQSNQFPRAMDIARELRAAGIPVIVGGFHVSGCVAMLPELPPDLRAMQDLGVSLFAGEAEGRLGSLFQDVLRGKLQPLYNFLLDLPTLQGQATPFLPREITRKYSYHTAFDGGRGCPFQCSFCTIINVQGRKSRYRDADDIERIVRQYVAQGIHRFFITDDNMARNENWEAILDRLIQLREKEGLRIKFGIQVDTMCHKIPGFIDKAARAGVNRVFIGMENINPENLAATKKFQNRITEYRRMLQAWRAHGVVTIAGYILGFPADTPESIERDIRVIQRELPIDILEFFILTPLPGSADHRALHQSGTWMDPDMNKYDLEHVTTQHARMTAEQWQQAYQRAWHQYYSPEHIQTLLRRAEASGTRARRIGWAILAYYGSYRFEQVHPLQCGIGRRKVRTTRRSDLPRENPFVFYARRAWEVVSTYASVALFALRLEWLARKMEADVRNKTYTDEALQPVENPEDETLELYNLTAASRSVVAKARSLASRKAA